MKYLLKSITNLGEKLAGIPVFLLYKNYFAALPHWANKSGRRMIKLLTPPHPLSFNWFVRVHTRRTYAHSVYTVYRGRDNWPRPTPRRQLPQRFFAGQLVKSLRVFLHHFQREDDLSLGEKSRLTVRQPGCQGHRARSHPDCRRWAPWTSVQPRSGWGQDGGHQLPVTAAPAAVAAAVRLCCPLWFPGGDEVRYW